MAGRLRPRGCDSLAGRTRSASRAVARPRRCSRPAAARGIAVRALVGDAQLSAWPQHPYHLAQRLCPPAGAPDVADRQAGDHRVERRRCKRKVTRVGIGKLRLVAHALGHRVALGGSTAVAALVTAPPPVRSHRPPPGHLASRQHQHRAAAASHVQDVLVAPQAQVVRQLRPDRACPVRRNTGSSPPASRSPRRPRPPVPRRQACDGAPPRSPRLLARLDQAEYRHPRVSAVDAVPAPLAGATTATGGRDTRDWLHPGSPPVADRDRSAGRPSSLSPTRRGLIGMPLPGRPHADCLFWAWAIVFGCDRVWQRESQCRTCAMTWPSPLLPPCARSLTSHLRRSPTPGDRQ